MKRLALMALAAFLMLPTMAQADEEFKNEPRYLFLVGRVESVSWQMRPVRSGFQLGPIPDYETELTRSTALPQAISFTFKPIVLYSWRPIYEGARSGVMGMHDVNQVGMLAANQAIEARGVLMKPGQMLVPGDYLVIRYDPQTKKEILVLTTRLKSHALNPTLNWLP